MMNEIENHFNLSDSEFENQFADGSLNPSLFNHEAHLRIAWLHIHKYGIEVAIANITTQLLSYGNKGGTKEKYNKTLTQAAMRTVYHFKRQSRSKNFRDFILEFPELKFNFKELNGFHYSNDIFNSIHENCECDYMEPELVLTR